MIKPQDIRIQTDPDFVYSKKHDYSLESIINSYPSGVPDRIICRILQITDDDLKKIYNSAIMTLKNGVD